MYNMKEITKENLILATKKRKIYVIRNFYKEYPMWSDIENIYDLNNGVNHNSFGTLGIENTQIVLKYYKGLLDKIKNIHSGSVIFGAFIIHFISRNNNIISDPHCLNLSNKFYKNNTKKVPKELIIQPYGVEGWPEESLDPTIHFDPEDRFFIQGCGQTLWKIFDDSKILNHAIVLNPGDLAYIPKKLIHSVESLCPRHSATIAFSDDPEIG